MTKSTILAFLALAAAGLAQAQVEVGPPATPIPNQSNVATADGLFTLSWSVPGSYSYTQVEQFIVSGSGFQQRGQWHAHASSQDSMDFAIYAPGTYRYRVKACNRTDLIASGFSSDVLSSVCGSPSAEIVVTVQPSAATARPSVLRSQLPAASGTASPTGGAATSAPGQFRSARNIYSGWTLFWSNQLRYPDSHPLYMDRNELHLLWTAHRDFAGPNPPQGQENLQPVWMDAALVQTFNGGYSGSIFYRTIVTNDDNTTERVNTVVGGISVVLSGNGQPPLVSWTLFDPTFYSTGVVVTVDDPLEEPPPALGWPTGPHAIDHFAGGWASATDFNSLDHVGWFNYVAGSTNTAVEYGNLAFYDMAGEPIWALADKLHPNPSSLTATDTGYCAYTVTNAWYPDAAMPPLRQIDVTYLSTECETAPATAWNLRRSYGPLAAGVAQTGTLTLALDVPASIRGTPRPLYYGTLAQPAPSNKLISNHDVRYRIGTDENPAQCQADGTGGCNVELTWFSDGVYPNAQVFRRRLSGGQWINPIFVGGWLNQDYSVADFPHTIPSEGIWRFELRRDNSNSQLIAFSPSLTVSAAPAPPETPPVPEPDPGFSVDAASARAGSTRGAFRVDESGAATYSIGLITVPGSGNLAPELSLNYSSRGGEGPLGRGWQLGGQSSITRCAQATEFGDAGTRAVDLSNLDQFCLDGQRLIWVSGAAHGTVGAVYRQEIDQFVQVTVLAETGIGAAQTPTKGFGITTTIRF